MGEESPYHGMTTNERLAIAGLIDAYDKAARKRDSKTMIEILTRVDLGSQAEWIAETTLSNPKKYGY